MSLEAVLKSPGSWGTQAREGTGKTVCLDYSSINIAKRFHIGHLSTTAIGNSLKRIYDFLGYRTVGINHLGDWGTQFGKMIAAYKHWGSREAVEQGGVQALSDLYVRFHEEEAVDPALEQEGRDWFKRIEDSASAGDFQLVQTAHPQGRRPGIRPCWASPLTATRARAFITTRWAA